MPVRAHAPLVMFALTLAGVVSIAVPRPARGEAAIASSDSTLLGIEIAVPLCSQYQPQAGAELEAAWRNWQGGSDGKSFAARIAASPQAAAQARTRMQPGVEAMVRGESGQATCRNFASMLKPAAKTPVDPEVAVTAYQEARATVLLMGARCSLAHPALKSEIDRAQGKWNAADPDVQKIVNDRLKSRQAVNPAEFKAQSDAFNKALGVNFDNLQRAGRSDAYCKSLLSALDRGQILAPEIYQALRRSPAPK